MFIDRKVLEHTRRNMIRFRKLRPISQTRIPRLHLTSSRDAHVSFTVRIMKGNTWNRKSILPGAKSKMNLTGKSILLQSDKPASTLSSIHFLAQNQSTNKDYQKPTKEQHPRSEYDIKIAWPAAREEGFCTKVLERVLILHWCFWWNVYSVPDQWNWISTNQVSNRVSLSFLFYVLLGCATRVRGTRLVVRGWLTSWEKLPREEFVFPRHTWSACHKNLNREVCL